MAKELKPEVVLLDLLMPGVDGVELLKSLTQDCPNTAVVIVSGQNEISLAVSCMKLGASDYLMKPFDRDALTKAVRRAMELSELRGENTLMREALLEPQSERPEAFAKIITKSPKMEAIFSYCAAIAGGRQPVMVCGETGSGKELISKAIHELSGRKGRFVATNLAGLDSTMFSDTLFGHVKGAFTGADSKRNGLVVEADGGTLFLDEIGELAEEAQVKLLRLLQEGEYSPLGSDEVKSSDARIVVATNRDLAAEVESGKFRRDLYFRLKIHHLRIPPLRERQEDIEALAETFIREAADEFGKNAPSLSPSALLALKSHPFKGNVRELRALCFDAVGMNSGQRLKAEDFEGISSAARSRQPEDAGQERNDSAKDESFRFPETLPTLKEMSALLVEEALKRTGGRQSAAAKLLGVTQQALSKRLKRAKPTRTTRTSPPAGAVFKCQTPLLKFS
jgi:DNA-binding NtrC family response regulator